jgi:hypothetical protein
MPDDAKAAGSFLHPSKGQLVIGVITAGVVAAYVYIKHKNQENAAAAAPSASAAGYGYGASAAGYGYGGLDSALAAQEGLYGNEYGYGIGVGTGTPPVAIISTNAEWAQAAEGSLSNDGYSAVSVAAALGYYLTGQSVNSSQESIVNAAIGMQGYPPTPGPNNYPPNIKSTGTGGQGGGGTSVPGYQAYAPGGKRLDQLTVPGVTYGMLAKANSKTAAKYLGKPLPKGYGYYVPKHNQP